MVGDLDIDENSIHIKASHAERAIAVAVDGLDSLVHVVLFEKFAPDVSNAIALIKLASDLKVLLKCLRQFNLRIREVPGEIGDCETQLRVFHALGDFFDALNGIVSLRECRCRRREAGNVRHNGYSLAVEIFKYLQTTQLQIDTPIVLNLIEVACKHADLESGAVSTC